MMNKLRESKLMFWSLELLIISTLLFVFTKIDFIFHPLFTLISTLFAPIVIAGILFYMLNPLVKLLMKFNMKRIWAIAVVFLLIILALVFLVVRLIPNLIIQVSHLIQNFPQFMDEFHSWLNQVNNHPFLKNVDVQKYWNQLDLSISTLSQKIFNGLSGSLGSIVSSVASISVIIVTSPFILFYMLKDGEKLVPAIKKFLPEKREDEAVELLYKMSDTISAYISGQALECLAVGLLTMIGYYLIGLHNYAILFGTIAGITNIIPYLGPYLGLAPAVLVTIFTDPFKALLACVVVIIVQQIDGNIIYPNIIGKKLEIHPITIVFILLVSGNLAGLTGMILGVPFYAIVKTVVTYVMDIVKMQKEVNHESQTENS